MVVALALVFAPRAMTTATHNGARVLTAAVLAPTTGDADAVVPASNRDAAPTSALLALLAAGLVLVVVRRGRPALSAASPPGPREAIERRSPRRGPPSLV
ncbi:MAG: hypothetical protein JWO68_925 [Actinomycetia bacterium]|nr:hypothetical protein [Actinomycetes bacterium]